MQINPVVSATNAAAVAAAQSANTPTVLIPVPGGNAQAFAIGALLNATVTQIQGKEAVLNLNGQAVLVRGATNLAVGAELNLKVTGEPGQPLLEVLSQKPSTDRAPLDVKVPTASSGNKLPQLALVDVVSKQPDGKLQVQIDGEPALATSQQPLQAGQRYTLQVIRTPNGLVLQPPPADSPETTTAIASAILRGLPSKPPELGQSVKPLLQELATLSETAPKPMADAASSVKQVLRTMIPDTLRAPNATEVEAAIRDGGQQYEAKIAEAVERKSSLRTAETNLVAKDATAPPARELGHDLKGTLLNLVETARTLRDASFDVPAARAALNGIEATQAVNALNQQSNGAFFMQIPIPDGDDWKTVHLAIEPEPTENDGETSSGFRVFMNVDLTELGETWIDVGMNSGGLMTVLYLNDANRERIIGASESLQTELQAEGFASAWVDVRSAADLPERMRLRAEHMKSGSPERSGLIDYEA